MMLIPVLMLITFLILGFPTLLWIMWAIGSINKHTVDVTVTHEGNRVADGNTINLYTCVTADGKTIILCNVPSIYGWKMIKETMAIDAILKEDGKYRVTVAGPDWFYGQNVLEAEKIQ